MSQNDDLISRSDLKKALTNKDLITWTHEYGDAIPVDWLMSVIDNAPTVEIPVARWDCYCEGQKVGYEKALSERPKGEWIFEEDIITFPGNHLKCSNCGFFAEPLNDGNLLLSSFCPYCGAKMKDWYPKRGEEE